MGKFDQAAGVRLSCPASAFAGKRQSQWRSLNVPADGAAARGQFETLANISALGPVRRLIEPDVVLLSARPGCLTATMASRDWLCHATHPGGSAKDCGCPAV